MEANIECPFCKDKPCNNRHCPYTKAKSWVKSLIPGINHANYEDRERLLKHINEVQDAYINSKKQE